MTIRVEHQKDYTCITNFTIRDKRLSFKARGLHHLLLSYPDGWQVKIEHLVNESEQDGRTAVASALRELEEYGYLERKQKRDPSTGKLGDWESIIRERPTENRKPDYGIVHKQETRKQETRKRVNRNQVSCDIINTNSEEVSKKQISILPPTPQGEEEGERNFGFEIRQEAQLVTKTVVKTDIAPIKVDPFFNRRRDPKDISWDWLPDGPWRSQEGKVEPEFWIAVAKRWVKEHGGDIHEKKVNVLKHFRNDPTNLVIEWEWYQSTTIHRAANIQTRKVNGLDTTADEQEITKHSSALKKLPQEMRVTESKTPGKLIEEVAGYATKYIEQVECTQETPMIESVATVTEDIWDKVKAETDEYESSVTTAPEGAENAQMYKHSVDMEARAYFEKLDQQKRQSAIIPISTESLDGPGLIAQQIKKLASSKSMPKANEQDRKEKTRLSHWNNLLSTGLPSVMAEAEQQVRKAGYIVVDGKVIEPEF